MGEEVRRRRWWWWWRWWWWQWRQWQARHLQRDRVDHDDLIAVQELALRRDRAARLDLDDDVVERQPDPQPVLLPQQVDSQLEHLLGGPGGL